MPPTDTSYALTGDLHSDDIVIEAERVLLQDGDVMITVSRPVTPRGVTLTAVAHSDSVGEVTFRLVQAARRIKANRLITAAIDECLEIP